MVDHLVFFAVREEASQKEVEDLVSSIHGLSEEVPSTVDLSVGEDFWTLWRDTHALFAGRRHCRLRGNGASRILPSREARRQHQGDRVTTSYSYIGDLDTKTNAAL